MNRLRVITPFAALLLLAAACSSDDGSSATTAGTTAPTTVTTVAGGDTNGGGDTGMDLGGLGALSNEECMQAVQVMATAFSGGFSQSADPDEIKGVFDRLAAVAPSDIADDLGFIAKELADFYAALQAAGVDFNDPNAFADPASAQAIAEAGEGFNEEAFTQASDNVSAWFDENCSGG